MSLYKKPATVSKQDFENSDTLHRRDKTNNQKWLVNVK